MIRANVAAKKRRNKVGMKIEMNKICIKVIIDGACLKWPARPGHTDPKCSSAVAKIFCIQLNRMRPTVDD